MRALLQKCRRLLLYGGLEREQYKRISPNINEANRKSVVMLSVACLIVLALRLCLRYATVPTSNRIVFCCGMVLFGLLAVLNTKVKKQWLIHLSAYLFIAFYLAIGILMAIGPESIQERTTLYLVFITVAPLLFALNAVDSVLGQGTQFTVQLRFATGGVTVREEHAAPVDFTGRRILLAEDNALNEEIARGLLADAGFEVDAVHDGAEALQTMESAAGDSYDLILMDIQMPRMNGYEATRKIRALKDLARAGIPIVAMTADAFEEDRRAALDAGMNGHISKPIEVTKLLETLGRILQ